MSMRELTWSKAEKQAARKAYEAAYRKECAAIAAKAEAMLRAASQPADLWKVHDYLKSSSASAARLDSRCFVTKLLTSQMFSR